MNESNTRLIPLSQGKFAIVDAEDFDWLSDSKWHLAVSGYAVTNRVPAVSGKRQGLMHRVIMGVLEAGRKVQVDHVDGDRLNNSRGNLRIATPTQNSHNRDGTAASGFKGVTFKSGQWVAEMFSDCQRYYIGGFATVEEAARAYDGAALHFAGEFARLNFSAAGATPYTPKPFVMNRRNLSGYRGVSYYAYGDKNWIAQINQDKVLRYLERFETAIEAARAYDEQARKFYGEKAKLNFD